MEPKYNRISFAPQSYLTESIELCQRDVILTLVKLTVQIANENNLFYAGSKH